MIKKLNRYLQISFLFSLLLAFSSCASNDVKKEDTKPLISDDYTLLVYMCGSNLESRLGKASANILEMQEASKKDNVNVIVQTGGSKKWVDEEISPSSTDRYLIKDGKKELIERDTFKRNFGDSDTLIDFIKFGVEHYPAKKMSLIFWNHGGGPTKGVCFDANFNNDSLSLAEIENALSATSSLISKWDFIGFDACLMANYDVAVTLSSYANYMIASEDLEPASGWDYKTLLSTLNDDDFYSKVINSYANKHANNTSYTLSAIDLSLINNATSIVNKIVEQLNDDFSNVSEAIFSKSPFGKRSENTTSGLFDLGYVATSLDLDFDPSSFIHRVNGVVHEGASGISIYFPTKANDFVVYSSICKNKEYLNYLTSYFSDAPKKTIEFTNRGYLSDNKLSFTLSSNSKKYIRSIGYELRAYLPNDQVDELYYVGSDNDVTMNNEIYTVDFSGNWVYLNDVLLHCEVYDETDKYTVFSSLIKINDEIGRLLFTYFKTTKAIRIDGYILESDVTSRVNEIINGMRICVLYEHVNTKTYIVEETIVWDDKACLSIKKLSSGRYQYIPYIIDIYNQLYAGRTATLNFDGENITDIVIAEG